MLHPSFRPATLCAAAVTALGLTAGAYAQTPEVTRASRHGAGC
jgi:hypothetical protein